MKDYPTILITTPDYLPQKGGLTTYTLNLEKVFQELKIPYDIFHWKRIADIPLYTSRKHYDYIINVHFMGGYYLSETLQKTKHINIFHGSELFFTSPSWTKKIIKKLTQKKMIDYIAHSYHNLFISSYTQSLAKEKGLSIDYARDIIFHNCIDIRESQLISVEFKEPLKLCSIIRNTPHKNVQGCIELAERLQKSLRKEVALTIPFLYEYKGNINLNCATNMNDEQREQVYKDSHFNLLLSLDHSAKGFIEGFGLSCLEAAKYGTPSIAMASGGIPDNVHPDINGFLLNATDEQSIQDILKKFTQDSDWYALLREKTREHTVNSHGLNQYQILFQKILK